MKNVVIFTLTTLLATTCFATGKGKKVANDSGCYQSQSDSNLQVCFIGGFAASQGKGYSNLKGRGVATAFDWQRTTRNILLTEVDRNTGKPSGCDSGVEIKGNVLTVTNLNSECGILSGKYDLIAE